MPAITGAQSGGDRGGSFSFPGMHSYLLFSPLPPHEAFTHPIFLPLSLFFYRGRQRPFNSFSMDPQKARDKMKEGRVQGENE